MAHWHSVEGNLVDLDEVYSVTHVFGEPNHVRYEQFFKDGRNMVVTQRHLKRDQLIYIIKENV